jgi:hypothetical protein
MLTGPHRRYKRRPASPTRPVNRRTPRREDSPSRKKIQKDNIFGVTDGGRKPLVSYERSGGSERRARLEPAEERRDHMPAVTRYRSTTARRRRTSSKKVRVIKGRVKLQVAGFPGVQSLSPAHLVQHIPSSRLRVAAKKVLKQTERATGKKKKKKRQKGNKGRNRKASKRRKATGKRSQRRKLRKKRRT